MKGRTRHRAGRCGPFGEGARVGHTGSASPSCRRCDPCRCRCRCRYPRCARRDGGRGSATRGTATRAMAAHAPRPTRQSPPKASAGRTATATALEVSRLRAMEYRPARPPPSPHPPALARPRALPRSSRPPAGRLPPPHGTMRRRPGRRRAARPARAPRTALRRPCQGPRRLLPLRQHREPFLVPRRFAMLISLVAISTEDRSSASSIAFASRWRITGVSIAVRLGSAARSGAGRVRQNREPTRLLCLWVETSNTSPNGTGASPRALRIPSASPDQWPR